MRAGFEFTPGRMVVGSNYHWWWLDEKQDALYTAGSVAIARADRRRVGVRGPGMDVQVTGTAQLC